MVRPAGIHPTELTGLAGLLNVIGSLPRLLDAIEAQGREIRALREDFKALRGAARGAEDGWLDAKAAARYLGMSAGTFDKYRYEITPAIKGYKVGSKTLYKRADLDNFVMLFEMKSAGLA